MIYNLGNAFQLSFNSCYVFVFEIFMNRINNNYLTIEYKKCVYFKILFPEDKNAEIMLCIA
jgi:hypothetical protein